MKQLLPRNFDTSLSAFPDARRWLLVGIVLACGMVTLPQRLQAGPVTGLALLTIGWGVAAWTLWLAAPWFPVGRSAKALLPLLLFTIYSVGSMLWYPPSVKGLQVLAVTIGFFGLLLLAARQAEREPAFVRDVYRALDFATLFATGLYAASVPLFGMGNNDFLDARSFALFALLGVARMLARWQAGETRAFFYAAAIVAVLVLSISRTAMVVAVVMFPLAALSRRDFKGVATAAAMALTGAAALGAAVSLSPMLRERFFGLDASMQVGGVAINASGRSAMWAMLWDAAQDGIWFGQGVGSSSHLIDAHFPKLGHPHNDYLRLLFDFGVAGLLCWVAFLGGCVWLLVNEFARRRPGRPDVPYFLAPLLALPAAAATMLTDNTIAYAFVMAPLGILVGCAIGLSHRGRRAARPDPRRAQRPVLPPVPRLRRPVPTLPPIRLVPAGRRRRGAA